MKLELKERTKVGHILENGDLGNTPKSSIRLLARYYIEQGKEKQEIMDILDKFLLKNLPEYNTVTWDKQLEKIVKDVIKFNKPLIELDSISITKEEIVCIKSLKNDVKQRLLFSYIVYYKILEKMEKSTDGWVGEIYRADIFREANTRYTGFKQLDIIKELVELGFMESAKGCSNNSFKLLYIKEENSDNPVELVVNDFRELGLQWLEYCGDNKIKRCEVCGKRYKIKSNRQKWCKECSEEKEREYDRKRKK